MKPPTSSHSMTWITPSFLRGTIEIPRSPSRCLVTGGLVVLLVTTSKLQIRGREWIKPTIHYQKTMGMNIQHHPVVSKNPVKIIGFPDPGKKKSPRHKSFSEIKFISSGSIWEGAGTNGHKRQPRSGWKIFSFQMCFQMCSASKSFQSLPKS